MPSPFPGMDPYLELPAFWRDFHGELIYACRNALLNRLPADYDAAVDEQVRLLELPPDASPPAAAKDVLPDVAVLHAAGRYVPSAGSAPSAAGTATLEVLDPVTIPVPAVAEVRDRWIEVRHRPDDSLVTLIEVLSPTNKNSDGIGEYRAKRRALLRHGVNLVELDLLVGGRRLEPPETLPAGDYYALVSRSQTPDQRDVYAWPVRRRLPAIPVPLRPPDKDVLLDLATAFATAYDRGHFGRRLRYRDLPPAALREPEAAWAADTAKQASP